MKTLKGSLTTIALLSGATMLFVAGCASTPPTELVNARLAYQQASQGAPAKIAPAELHKAKVSLDKAEAAYADKPDSQKTRDLAYIAERKAQLATSIAATRTAEQTKQEAQQDYRALQAAANQQTRDELAAAREDLVDQKRAREQERAAMALGAETGARQSAEKQAADAEARAKAAEAALAKLGDVKQEPRGMVISLTGSVVFATNESTLLPAAQSRLDKVANALMETKDRHLIVEGHTDSQGSASYNQSLSQRRAESVRSYLISRGYPAAQIQARGIGQDRPVANNATAEGRANNRRVEIIVEPAIRSASR